MFAKHYISLLIVVVSLLGIASQEQAEVPNQEIVVQFSSTNVTAQEVDVIISSIKEQLRELGVEEVHVNKNNLGELKITYHSNTDVSSIKNKLAKADSLTVDLNKKSDNTSNPQSNRDIVSYNLDIYEIQDKSATWDLNGIHVANFDAKSDHSFNPSTNLLTPAVAFNNAGSAARETYKVLRNLTLSINEIPYKIPEVRAGPTC